MSKRAYDKIAAGLEDAIAFVQGDASKRVIHAAPDVKAIRAKTRKTQTEFARAYRLPAGTVRDWEQKRRQPDAPARVLLGLIEQDPERVERMIKRGGG